MYKSVRACVSVEAPFVGHFVLDEVTRGRVISIERLRVTLIRPHRTQKHL